ncbi:MAG: phytanoyl-CoA dioxygenase family protein [Planctomycetota bacterium]|nr:phytanoyl-CoA dioxygenase family protein [Planctomycetota bacterium]
MQLTASEIQAGALAPERLALAVQKVKADGYVVLEHALPPAFVAELHAAFMERFQKHLAASDGNRGANRYQMHLPFEKPFCDERVIANPLALSVIDAVLGPKAVCHYFASDTPMPGSDYQAVHSDIHALFPETGLTVPAYGLVLNIPLVDFRADNGPVEIWPGGTHLIPMNLDLKALAPEMRSELCLMPAGSFLIRDLRMWHRGTPNRSTEPRPNMAMIYARPWLRTEYPPIRIAPAAFEALSPRAQELFRHEKHA